MKIKHIFLGLSIAITSTLFGQIDRSIVPKPGPAPEIHIADPVVFELDNGMKVILSSNHKIPKVSFNLVMGSDARLEGEKAGVSNMMGELLLSGTSNRTKDELDEEKDFIGASLSATSSNVFLNVMTKHLDKGLDLMTDVMRNANFPDSEFERIKKQSESGLYSIKSDPSSMARNAVSKTIFTDQHPYGEIMTEKSLNNISRQDVIDFYNEQFTPSGSFLVIVGDINEADAKKIAKDRFGNWTGKAPFKATYNTGKIPEGNKVVFVNQVGAVQSQINIAFPIDITPGHEDQIKLSVLNKIFGGHGFGARLMQNLREDKAFTYGAYSSLDVDRDGSYLSAAGSFRNEVTDSAIVEFLSEIEIITKDVVTDEELDLAKAALAGAFARSLESSRTVANFAYNIFRNNLPADYYQTYLQKLDAVTKDDVLNMAKKYFKPNNLNIIVVGNQEEVLESLVKFDADGEIDILDAFGDPYVEAEYRASDLTNEEVVKKYLMAITQTNSFKATEDKIDQIITLKEEGKNEISGYPVEMTTTKYYKAPNMSYEKVEMMGNVVSENVFTGTKGMKKNMNQFGGVDENKMTKEEVADQRKIANIFAEFSLVCCHPDDLKLLGITDKKGNSYYVVEYENGDMKVVNYYNTKTFLKDYTEVTMNTAQGPQNFVATLSDYTDFGGYLFPKTTSRIIESMNITSTVTNIEINGSIDEKVFKF